MKVSKSLLQSIALGLAIGAATTSCNTIFNPITQSSDAHHENCEKDCDEIHERTINEDQDDYYCPPCGRG